MRKQSREFNTALRGRLGKGQDALRSYEKAQAYTPADDEMLGPLARQIERMSHENPNDVPPLRNPVLE